MSLNPYTSSTTARSMLNEIVTDNKTLQIKYVAGEVGAYVGQYIVELDLQAITGGYIDPNGNGIARTLNASLAHELVHAIKGLRDADI